MNVPEGKYLIANSTTLVAHYRAHFQKIYAYENK